MPDAQIEARGIGKRFGRFQALQGVNIDVQQGEFLTLLGPSGSGKSTFLNLLAGFERPDEGVIRSLGRDITNLPAEARNFGMVFQGYALFPHMTVAENIGFPLRVRGQSAEHRRTEAKRMLSVVGLDAHADKLPTQISGGQQQRAALARALVFRPDILLLDEPLSALDKNLREQMQLELRRIHREVGTTFVFVTHDQDEALAMSDRVAIFNHGQLCQIGAPRDVYLRPQSRFVAEFLGTINIFSPRNPGDPPFGVRPEMMRIATTAGMGRAVSARVTNLGYHGARLSVDFAAAQAIGPVRLDLQAAGAEAALCRPGVELLLHWDAEAEVPLPN